MRRPIGVAPILITALIVAAPARANGPCGQDFDGNHACGVSSPASYSGSLLTDNERDYYVFYAQTGTELSVSITNTENPQCSSGSFPIACGYVEVDLYDANGSPEFEGASSHIENGITAPGTFSHTLNGTGAYYLIVSGGLGYDEHDNGTSVPYTLGVSASPGVQWPAPTPPPPTPTPLAPSAPSAACLRDRADVAHEQLVLRRYTRLVHTHRLSRRIRRRYERALAGAHRSLDIDEGQRHRQCPGGQ